MRVAVARMTRGVKVGAMYEGRRAVTREQFCSVEKCLSEGGLREGDVVVYRLYKDRNTPSTVKRPVRTMLLREFVKFWSPVAPPVTVEISMTLEEAQAWIVDGSTETNDPWYKVRALLKEEDLIPRDEYGDPVA